MALLSVIHTATVCWDVYKVSIERAQSRETLWAGTGHLERLGLEQIKASRLLAAGPGSPVPDRAATIIGEAGEMRLPPPLHSGQLHKAWYFQTAPLMILELAQDYKQQVPLQSHRGWGEGRGTKRKSWAKGCEGPHLHSRSCKSG